MGLLVPTKVGLVLSDELAFVLLTRLEPKSFRQYAADGRGGWTAGRGNTPDLCYRLPYLQGKPKVVIVEGERDVDSVTALHLPATCNAGGAGKWRATHAEQLRAAGVRTAVLLPDNDAPGERHMHVVAQTLRAEGIEVRWLMLPGLLPKGDVSDALRGGLTKARLVELLNDAPLYVPPASWAALHGTPKDNDREAHAIEAAVLRERATREARRRVDVEELAAGRTAPPRLVRLLDLCDPVSEGELVERVITGDSLCVLWGPSNTGKTTVALALAVAVATGGSWCGRRCRRTPVAVLAYEGRHGLRRRLDAAAQAQGVEDLREIDLYVVEHPPKLDDPAGLAALREMFTTAGIGFTIVDTLTAACGGGLDIGTGAGGDAARHCGAAATTPAWRRHPRRASLRT